MFGSGFHGLGLRGPWIGDLEFDVEVLPTEVLGFGA